MRNNLLGTKSSSQSWSLTTFICWWFWFSPGRISSPLILPLNKHGVPSTPLTPSMRVMARDHKMCITCLSYIRIRAPCFLCKSSEMRTWTRVAGVSPGGFSDSNQHWTSVPHHRPKLAKQGRRGPGSCQPKRIRGSPSAPRPQLSNYIRWSTGSFTNLVEDGDLETLICLISARWHGWITAFVVEIIMRFWILKCPKW